MKTKILFAFIACGLIAFSSCDKAVLSKITVTDYDGNKYQTVKIGNQIWMAENLWVTHYPNGTEIPHVTDNNDWGNLGDNNTDDAYCFYDNWVSSIGGGLYTWAAAMGDNAVGSNTNPSGVQGVCPDGWHLPSEAEWTELIEYLGTNEAGGKLKETGTSNWISPNTGATNETGFTALPGGIRSSNYWGEFTNEGHQAIWWSSRNQGNTQDEFAYVSSCSYYTVTVDISLSSKSTGHNVRCVKD